MIINFDETDVGRTRARDFVVSLLRMRVRSLLIYASIYISTVKMRASLQYTLSTHVRKKKEKVKFQFLHFCLS